MAAGGEFFGGVFVLLGLLTLVSYVDRVYQEIGKFLSREFQDNIDSFEQFVEPRLGVGRERAALVTSGRARSRARRSAWRCPKNNING